MDILQVLKIRQEIQISVVSENLMGLTDFFVDNIKSKVDDKLQNDKENK